MRIAPLVLLAAAFALDPAVARAQTPPSNASDASDASDAVNPWQSEPAPGDKPVTGVNVGDSVDPWQDSGPPEVRIGKARRGRKQGPQRATPERKAVPAYVPAKGQAKKGARVNPDAPIAWFPGFLRLENGTTRIFLEISKHVEITEHRAEGRVTYRLKGAGVPERVNRMPLVTAWFPTAIARVQLVPAGPDADLVIELKRPSESAYRVLDTPRGIVLQVDFPPLPGTEGAPPPPPAALGSTSTQLPGAAPY
ncbi:MAG TPA: hypothetical protein VGM56_21170 [Byssovorax sp.]|jgi:hypothetical protein